MSEPQRWRVEMAVRSIVEDILDRRDFRQLWEQLDEETARDIRAAWETIVTKAFTTTYLWERDE